MADTSRGQPILLNQRRSNIEIIAEMLRAGEKGAGKTRMMYGANMSYSQIQKYLDFLVHQGFLNKVDVGVPTGTYQVTESGIKLLRLIDSLTEMLGIGEEEHASP